MLTPYRLQQQYDGEPQYAQSEHRVAFGFSLVGLLQTLDLRWVVLGYRFGHVVAYSLAWFHGEEYSKMS